MFYIKKLQIETNHSRGREFNLEEKWGRVTKNLRTPGLEYIA